MSSVPPASSPSDSIIPDPGPSQQQSQQPQPQQQQPHQQPSLQQQLTPQAAQEPQGPLPAQSESRPQTLPLDLQPSSDPHDPADGPAAHTSSSSTPASAGAPLTNGHGSDASSGAGLVGSDAVSATPLQAAVEPIIGPEPNLQPTQNAQQQQDQPQAQHELEAGLLEDPQQQQQAPWPEDDNGDFKRVKVYELIGSRWVDQGTAFCFGDFQDNEALLVARSEANFNTVILSTTIRSNDVYQRQQGKWLLPFNFFPHWISD